MRSFIKKLKIAVLLIGLTSLAVHSEDIDIFSGTTVVDTDLPNVIFIIDNSANWSKQSQQWPGGLTQGQSEVRAIKTALAAQVDKLNIGFMEYDTNGGGADSGFVRFDLQKLTTASFVEFSTILDTIFNNINSPIEKRNQSNSYGDLLWDFYNYLDGGFQSQGGGSTPASIADTDGYTSNFDRFESPLLAADLCVNTYVIWIGNNRQGGNFGDSAANTAALKAAYIAAGTTAPDALVGDSGTPLAMPEFTTVTTTEPGVLLGTSGACWKSDQVSACTVAENTSGQCVGEQNCSCTSQASSHPGCQTTGNPNNRTFRWDVEVGGGTTTVTEATGAYDTSTGISYNFDDWAKYLHNYGILLTGTTSEGDAFSERVNVTTYAIDVYNAQSQAALSGVWFSAANAGGGRYFQARNEEAIIFAITSAINDIISANSSFAAVTLPLSASNRANAANQVFIGLFRPSPGKKPRWFGNLKQYQLGLFNGAPQLADVDLRRAVNPINGFLAECAASFWTHDTSTYWESLGVDPPPVGQCLTALTSDWSDLPDGPLVEKGGVAQMTREGGARTIFTVNGSSLTALASSHETALGGADVLSYLIGATAGTAEVMPPAGLRASIHGDVVHSRPLAISYNEDDVAIYYGANDGTYRGVNAANGSELWALVAPEHFDKFARLDDNAPLVLYTGSTGDAPPTHTPKDYFFDGSTGQVVVYDNNNEVELAYIFPTMRRGGRMVYALDVTDPNDPPALLWRKGCPNLTDDTGCSTSFTGIGQTWSTPLGGFLGSYVDGGGDMKPVVMFGGGFDDCLNNDAGAYPSSCSSAKGRGVFVLDATTGAVIKAFATDGPVISDLAPIDINFDGTIDFAYLADAKGNLYRIKFTSFSLLGVDPWVTVTDLPIADWEIEKIGHTTDNEKRFYNAPTVAAFRGIVFLAIGSGDRERPLEINYPYAEDVDNRFYVLIDKPYLPTTVDVDLDGNTMFEVKTSPTGSFTINNDGWFMELPDTGEQVVNNAAIGGGKVFFNSFQPGGVSTGICSKPLGIGTAYALDLFSPDVTEGTELAGEGMPIAPVIATVTIPPGNTCVGAECDSYVAPDCSDSDAGCEKRTVCIGCEGFEPVEIIPTAPPIRERKFWTEDIDRE